MATMRTLIKQSKEAQKFVLFSNEFGFDLFIANDFDKEVIVEKIDTAMQFSVGFDDEQIKLKTYTLLTGYQLQIKYI